MRNHWRITFLLILGLIFQAAAFPLVANLFQGSRPQTVPENVKILILPGFGNDSSDYVLSQAPQGSLVRSLQKRGWKDDQIQILPVARGDWLQVFTRGLFDIQFWLGSSSAVRPSFCWYLQKICDEITKIRKEDPQSKIVLVCHSAGGWLGRAALGYGAALWDDTIQVDLSGVLGMVTLGSPHLPPPPEVMDMTRGALRITNADFPGAFHKEDLFYVTVAGAALAGVKQERSSPFEKSTPTGIAFNSYEAVCGDGTSMGDGLVPRASAHLEDALQLNLDGVFHSIDKPDKWYGSDTIVDRWHTTMLQEIARVDSKGSLIDKVWQQVR